MPFGIFGLQWAMGHEIMEKGELLFLEVSGWEVLLLTWDTTWRTSLRSH
jgi:hypothetical protein